MRRLNKSKIKNIFNFIIVFAILALIGIRIFDEYKEEIIEETVIEDNYHTKILNIEEDKTNEMTYDKEEVISEYRGYNVVAKLVIPKIELDTFVLKNYSINALNISVTKFWGPEPNEEGNLCIAGHNFKNKNMFRNLKKLEIGDNFFISDNKIGKVEYEIYGVYVVEPEDTKCLSQETNGEKEVTLITCTSDSKKRIIIKAKEKNRN